MISAKMATPGLLKIAVFWNRSYDVIIPVDDVTNKIFSLDLNDIVDVFMWTKFGNSSISMRDVITTSVLKGFDQKNRFFLRGGLGSSSINWDLHQVQTWNFTPVWQNG